MRDRRERFQLREEEFRPARARGRARVRLPRRAMKAVPRKGENTGNLKP